MLQNFSFKKKKCLNCEADLPRGRKSLFCEKCEPQTFPGDPRPSPKKETNVGDCFLPDDLVEDQIKNMPEGKNFYTVPWAMFADSNRQLFVVGTYTYESNIMGTVHMKIRKENGIILVDRKSIGNQKYSPGTPCYMGVTEADYIPARIVENL